MRAMHGPEAKLRYHFRGQKKNLVEIDFARACSEIEAPIVPNTRLNSESNILNETGANSSHHIVLIRGTLTTNCWPTATHAVPAASHGYISQHLGQDCMAFFGY